MTEDNKVIVLNTGREGCWLGISLIDLENKRKADTISLIDSGSFYSICPHEIAKYGANQRPLPSQLNLVGASGNKLKTSCLVDLNISVSGKYHRKQTFIVLSPDSYLSYIIIGLDFLNKNKAILDICNSLVSMVDKKGDTNLHPYVSSKPSQTLSLRIMANTVHPIQQGKVRLGEVLHRIKENEIQIDDNEDADEEMFDNNPTNIDLSHLDTNIQSKVREIIKSNINAFSKGSDDLGKVPRELYNCVIKFQPNKYCWSSPHRTNPKEEKILIRREKKLIRMGILVPNTEAPKCQSINMIVKKNNDKPVSVNNCRTVCDLRKCNQLMDFSPHSYSVNIETLKNKLANYKYLTHLDMSDAFFCLQIDEESSHYFSCYSLVYPLGVRYVRLTQGARCSPVHMQACMAKMLLDLEGKVPNSNEDLRDHVIAFMDGIFVVSFNSPEEHVFILDKLLKQIIKWGFLLRMSKAKFLVKETIFLGTVIDPQFQKAELQKINAIKHQTRPTNKKECRQF